MHEPHHAARQLKETLIHDRHEPSGKHDLLGIHSLPREPSGKHDLLGIHMLFLVLDTAECC